MTAPLAILRIAWPYMLCTGIGFGVGDYLEKNHWETKYEALQAGHAQELADAQEAARKALQAQMEQFQATAQNNERVINALQIQTQQAQADSVRDRDLVQRLLNAASRDPRYHSVPQAGDQSAVASASGFS